MATTEDQDPTPGPIDVTIPQSARVYDYWLGGRDNYPPDRELGEALAQAIPTIRTMVRAQRALLSRIVRYLAGEAGVTQFFDVGTGIPTFGNVHEVAQAVVPDSRVLYVDNDPIVLAHARALMTSSPEGYTDFILADLRDPDAILGDPAFKQTLDLSRPVALMLVGILHHLRDDDRPYEAVGRLLDVLPSGSALVIVHPGSDFDREAMVRMAATAQAGGIPYVPRSKEECARFFDGLEMVEPGLVPILAWRPEMDPAPLHPVDPDSVWGWAGVGRKP